MQTSFTLAQLNDPDVAESEKILRACVHCGFCTATCPTYVLLGDELDSPRGRIYLIKDMLENGKPADGQGREAYRPLPLLPLLHDHLPVGRALHASGRSRPRGISSRPIAARWLDRCAAQPARGRPAQPGPVPPGPASAAWLAQAAGAAAAGAAAGDAGAGAARAAGAVAGRSAAGLPGRGRAPEARRAADRLRPAGASRRRSTRRRSGCSPAMASRWWWPPAPAAAARSPITWARRRPAHAAARANIAAWSREIDGEGLDAIVINASGCGTTVKDYGFMFREDPLWARARRARVRRWPATSREFLSEIGLRAGDQRRPASTIAYHSACSHAARPEDHGAAEGAAGGGRLHGARRAGGPSLLRLGRHLQPAAAGAGRRAARPQARATSRRRGPMPSPPAISAASPSSRARHRCRSLHTVELLDWATGGPRPGSTLTATLINLKCRRSLTK